MSKLNRSELRKLILEEIESEQGVLDRLSHAFAGNARVETILEALVELEVKIDKILDRLDGMRS